MFYQIVHSQLFSAIAAGDIIIRDKANQKQDVADLSRDTENAHKALDNNFDKQAIQDKLEIQQQATLLGTQAMTAYMDSKLDASKKKVRDEMAARGELNGLSDTEIDTRVMNSAEFKAVDAQYGIGSPFWTASSALTGLLAGVMGGNVQSGVAAGAAPVLARLVKEAAGKDNEAARIALHTVISAALAKAQGGNATAGAIGGFIASAGAESLAQALYGKDADQLNPDEKMVVLNLVTAIGAAGGGVASGDTSGMVSAGNAARVEVENNSLAHVLAATEKVKPGTTEAWEKARREQIKEICGNNPPVSCKTVATIIATGLSAGAIATVTPELIALVQVARSSCAADFVLCANEVSIWLMEVTAADALPAGLTLATASNMSIKELSELQAIMSVERQTGNKFTKEALSNQFPVARQGNVTYELLSKPDAKEIRAGQKFADLGYDVTYKATASDKDIQNVKTQDLWIDGIGKVDIYTPKTTDLNKVVTAIEKKNKQTTAGLTQIDLTGKDMQNIASRVWGKPGASNINTVFFQDSTGRIHRFDRPMTVSK